MASNSSRKSASSGRPGQRKQVVIGAKETVRVRYQKGHNRADAERAAAGRGAAAHGPDKRKKKQKKVSPHARRVSAAKREQRERRQRLIRLRLWGIAAAVLIVVALCVWGIVSLYNAPVFVVKQTRIIGLERLTDEQVRALAAVSPGTTLLKVPSDAIARRIETNPWVSSVEIEKDYPSTLIIRVTERASSVVVDAGGTDLWMVSGDGVWLGKSSKVGTDTIVVRDLEAKTPVAGERTESAELLNAIKIVKGISPELRSMVRAISAPTIDKTALITEDDVEIYFGAATQLARKDSITRSILAKQAGKVVYINVRVQGHETWRGLDSQD